MLWANACTRSIHPRVYGCRQLRLQDSLCYELAVPLNCMAAELQLAGKGTFSIQLIFHILYFGAIIGPNLLTTII